MRDIFSFIFQDCRLKKGIKISVNHKAAERLRIVVCMTAVLSLLMIAAAPPDGNFGEGVTAAADTIGDISGWRSEEIGSFEELCARTGESVCDWLAFSEGRLGAEDVILYAEAAEQYFDDKGDSLPVTDIQRIALAAAACGADISKNGMLAAAVLEFSDEELSSRLINHLIFTLKVLDCGMYEIPEGIGLTRSALIDEILSRQLDNGALYMLNENTPETDITAMAVQALSPYVNGDEKVRTSVDRMLVYLSGEMTEQGTMKNWGVPSCETTAQTIAALCSLGLDPDSDTDFIRNGKTLIDGLMTYRQSDGGFLHNDDGVGSDAYATAQACYSLISYIRMKKGLRTLYDMRSEHTEKLTEKINNIFAEINFLETNDSADIDTLISKYAEIPVSERMYVTSFFSPDSPAVMSNIFKAESYSPDELAVNEGVGEPSDILIAFVASDQTITSAESGVVPISDSDDSASLATDRKTSSTAEVVILLVIAAGAAGAIAANHTLLGKGRSSQK